MKQQSASIHFRSCLPSQKIAIAPGGDPAHELVGDLSQAPWSVSFALTNSSLDVQRCTSQEERPPTFLLTDLAEGFQIPHLTNRSTPLGQKPLVQTPTSLHWWRPRFERHSISCYSGEVMVVKPADCGLVILQSNGAAVRLCAVLALFRRGVVVPADVSARRISGCSDSIR